MVMMVNEPWTECKAKVHVMTLLFLVYIDANPDRSRMQGIVHSLSFS